MPDTTANQPALDPELEKAMQEILMAINSAEAICIREKKDTQVSENVARAAEALSKLWIDAYSIKHALKPA